MRRDATIPVAGADLAAVEAGAGSGAPLVLVHGTGARAASWGGTIEDLVTGGRRVIAYDRRGYGDSHHRPVRDYRVHVSDLEAVVRHGSAPAHLVGWSSGGNVALALAARSPELVRSVAVMEAPWHGLRGVSAGAVRAVLGAKLAEARGRPRDGAARFFRWAAGTRDGGNGFDRLDPTAQEDLYAHAAVVLAELDPHPFGLMMEHVPTGALRRIPAPITWLLGERSIPWYASLCERARRSVPSIVPVRIPRASHLAHIEEPAAFAAAVLTAIGRAPGSRGVR